ncbi:MAG: hypothetical protein MZV70_77055 [Desulfobacterales bacterium]|nr:hypothetical protein [Desulfobacterales bacterium]
MLRLKGLKSKIFQKLGCLALNLQWKKSFTDQGIEQNGIEVVIIPDEEDREEISRIIYEEL